MPDLPDSKKPVRDMGTPGNNNVDLPKQELLSLPIQIAGSNADYCNKVTWSYQHNENSLMLMETAILHTFPKITLRGLGFILSLIKVACLIIFSFFLLSIGGSPILALLVGIIGIFIIGIDQETFYYLYYPFFMPFTVLLMALFGLALRFNVHKKLLSAFLAMFGIGMFGGLLFNLRSSYLPIILSSLFTYVAFTIRPLNQYSTFSHVHRFNFVTVIIFSFISGMAIFHILFINPILNVDNPNNLLTYHHISHPLVFGLANPENELTKREGIKWKDNIGMELARRIDKTIDWNDHKYYQKVMFTYYFKLWKNYPKEMVDIYIKKLRIAGHDVLIWVRYINNAPYFKKFTKTVKIITIITMPLSLLPNGIFYLALFVGILITSFIYGFKFLNGGASFALSILTLSGLLLLIEATMIYPYFTVMYQSYLLFFVCICGLLVYQVATNLLSYFLWSKVRR